MKRRILFFLFIVIGFILPTKQACSQKFTFSGNRVKSSIPFQFVQNLVIIQLRVNGSDPLNFILDSGVSHLIITDSVLVDTLQHEYLSHRIRGRGVGPDIEAYLVNEVKVSIGKHASASLTAVLLKEAPFRLSTYLGMPIHGIIGSDFFSSFKVNLSYTKKKIKFTQFDVPMKLRGTPLPIQVIAGKPYMEIGIMKEHGELDTLLLLIDTGAGHALSLDLKDQDLDIQPQQVIAGNLGIGLSGPIKGYIGRLKSVEFAGFNIKNMIAAFPKYQDTAVRNLMTTQNGSIGGGLLHRFNVQFDYAQQVIHLKRNRYYKTPFEYDMLGIELYVIVENKKKRYFVHRVEQGSPAERHGFQQDDEIIMVNFTEVRKFSLHDLYGLFKKESKDVLILQLRRGKELLIKLITLRRRI